VHAPFSLGPCALPAECLREAYEIAPLFGKLVDEVGKDVPWLSATLLSTGESDDFTKRLLKLCARVQSEGKTQKARLAILRSDYMLHTPVKDEPPQMLQVELNTIASSFAGLSQRVADMHLHLAQRWPSLQQHAWKEGGKPAKLSLLQALPPNPAADGIAEGLARGHALYGNPDAAILFVVQPHERNHVDQEHVVQALWRTYGVRVLFRTLSQIGLEAKLVGKQRKLTLPAGEVSVVYFRAGYTPNDYVSNRQWDARALLERSYAIKCPSIEYHLVGCKKVQQQLAQPGELERFLDPSESERLRRVFAGLWSLSGPSDLAACASDEEREAALAMARACDTPADFVMKPQREGGGNNLFGAQMKHALQTFSREQRSGYILMQRIFPEKQLSVMVRAGKLTVGPAISEIGVYSSLLVSKNDRVLLNKANGHLVRTKQEGVDEGGVAAGFAVLSSPLLTSPKWK